MSELGERLIAALAEHGNTLPALEHLMAEAWEEGFDKGWDAARGEPQEANPYEVGLGE